MSLDTKILGLDQKVDFSDGSMSNVIRIELPRGAVVVALVTDEGAQSILEEVQAAKNLFKAAPVQRQAPAQTPTVVFSQDPHTYTPNQPAFEFGGAGAGPQEDDDEPVVGPQMGPALTRVRIPDSDAAGNPMDASGRPLYDRATEAHAPAEQQTDEDGVRGL